jgi:hypothetical protein
MNKFTGLTGASVRYAPIPDVLLDSSETTLCHNSGSRF